MVVFEAQNTFVSTRQVLDAYLIANEAIDYKMRGSGSGSNSGILCKFDIKKAFDNVN